MDDAWRVTFLWQGDPELTHHVSLVGGVVFTDYDDGGRRFEHIPGTDIWHLTLRVPSQTRAEYAISPNGLLRPLDGPDGERLRGTAQVRARYWASWLRDPFNSVTFVTRSNAMLPRLTPRVSSVLEAPDAPAQPWSTRQPGTPAGRVEEHTYSSVVLQNSRSVWTYSPPGWDPRERGYQLLLAFDGWSAVNRTELPVVLDNLIAAGAIPPVVAVLVDAGPIERHGRELNLHEPFLEFLTDELLPWAHERWGLVADRSKTIVTGMSLAGLAAVYAGLRRPDVFGNVLAQTTAVSESKPPILHELATRKVQGADRVDFYLDVGLLEGSTGDKGFLFGSRMLRNLLQDAGHTVHYAELACGHDPIVFRESIADGLRLLSQPSTSRA
jgi:enterochelin esterase family protein